MKDTRGVRAWMLFDWANQPFYTLVITFIFAPWFTAAMTGDPVEGQAIWADVTALASILVALTAPMLGAIADQAGPRKPWIATFSLFFIIGCTGLWGAMPGMQPLWPVLALFVLAFVASEYMLIFTSAMLPDLGPRSEVGRISGSGWALGYAGGVVVLAIVLLFLAPSPGKEATLIGLSPPFGLDPATGGPARATGPLTAIWFAVFALPLFMFTPDAPRKRNPGSAVAGGLRQLGRTLAGLPKSGGFGRFLLASMIYRDALAGLFLFGAIYARGVLGWGAFELGVFGIISALVGVLGAWGGGRLDRALGPRPVIVAAIITLILVSAAALTTAREMVLGLPVAPESHLPDLIFYTCGGLMGAAAGALQAASRTMVVHLADGQVSMTEAFGLYAFSGKATAFIAPVLIGLATRASGSQAVGVSPVIVLFAIGLALLYWVKSPREV